MLESPSKSDALREMRFHMASLVSWARGLQASMELVVLMGTQCPLGSETLRVPEHETIWRMDLEAALGSQSSYI